MHFNYSEGIPASLVLSSQIAGYSSGEVDSNATVDITFPVKVYIYIRICIYTYVLHDFVI